MRTSLLAVLTVGAMGCDGITQPPPFALVETAAVLEPRQTSLTVYGGGMLSPDGRRSCKARDAGVGSSLLFTCELLP